MSEARVLAACISQRAAYISVEPYHEPQDFSDVGELVWKEVQHYYTSDPEAQTVDLDSLRQRLARKYPKHVSTFEAFVEGSHDVSVPNVLEDFRAAKMDSLGDRIGGYLCAQQHAKAGDLLEQYNRLKDEGLQAETAEDSGTLYCDVDVREFKEKLSSASRIKMLPRQVNDVLGGGLIPGCHVLVYAPPETGKTAFALTQAYAFCYQGKRVLYVGNEETAIMYLDRMICRFSGMTHEEVEADPDAAMEAARQRGYDNLFFYHLSPGSTDEVFAKALELDVDVLILDQLHNLKHSQYPKYEGTQALTALAYSVRMFCSKHEIAGLSFTQADEQAIGKRYLTIKNVYYSNIGVQGQTDAMIGIGMDSEYQSMNRRMLCFTKNKLGGQHPDLTVSIEPKQSLFKEIPVRGQT